MFSKLSYIIKWVLLDSVKRGIMDVIKSYLELTDYEIIKAYDFINRKEDINGTKEEIDRSFNKKIYNYGEGVLFYFKNKEVVGSVCIVTKEIKILGTAYIHNIEILESELEEGFILKSLINTSIEKAFSYGAKDIFIGVRDEFILEGLKKIGFKNDYNALVMRLENKESKGNTLDLVTLSEINRNEYLKVYNDSFNDMPHGASLDKDEIDEYLKILNEENYFSMVSINGENIGFFNCEIENEKGKFDIGLCKEYRGKGYGKLLLETAIKFLTNKNVNKISLIVIEKNEIAHNLYKKRGFKKESILSYWISNVK